MEEVEKTQKQKLTTGEIIWTAVCSLIAVGGLFMVILGIVGDYLPVKASENWILARRGFFPVDDEDELSLVRRHPSLSGCLDQRDLP
jgi:hypothetical protein